MLRISSDKAEETNTGKPTVTRATTATGTGGTETPTLNEKTDCGPKSTQQVIEGNHAAHVLPWLTEEIRFHAALDLGCGNGEAVKLLQDAGYDGHGLDLNPTSSNIQNIQTGDFYQAPYADGFFDVVICCNVFQDIPNYRTSELLAEIDRLSNSYIMITAPSTESDFPQGEAREIAWWCERISDFGWRYRIVREDPETGHMVILAEKPNSLAAQILPLIDAGTIDGSGDGDQVAGIINKIDSAVETLESGDHDLGFTMISQLADLLLNAELNLSNVQSIFTEIILAMEQMNVDEIVRIMRSELRPALDAG